MKRILFLITILAFTQVLIAQKVSVVSSDQNHLKLNVSVSTPNLIPDIKHEGVRGKKDMKIYSVPGKEGRYEAIIKNS